MHGIKYNNNWNLIEDKLKETKVPETQVKESKNTFNSIWDLQYGVNYII